MAGLKFKNLNEADAAYDFYRSSLCQEYECVMLDIVYRNG